MVKTTKKEEFNRVSDVLRKIQAKSSAYADAMLLENDLVVPCVTTSSGILSVDLILGGGYPHGKLIELYGPPGGGKTTATLHALEARQRVGGIGVFVDVEHALDLFYAKRLGVDVSKLLFFQPNSGEDALNFVIDLVSELRAGDLIVVDSVAALVPRVELEGIMGDQHMGVQARMIGQAMRKLQGAVSKANVTVLFINQTRQKIGVTYGDPTTTPGGDALKFAASIRIEVKRVAAIKKGEEVVGNKVKFKVVKNKVYPPFKEVETAIKFGFGVPRSLDVLNLAVSLGVVEKSGAWLSYNGEQLGQGVDNAAEALTLEIINALEQKIMDCYRLQRLE